MKTKRGPGRPPLIAGEKKERANFALYPRHHKLLRKRAENKKVSMSELLAQLIEAPTR